AAARGHLADVGCLLHTVKDHVVFERDEILTATGTPYSVFTPYKNAWLRKLDPFHLRAYPVARHAACLAPWPPAAGVRGIPALAAIGFAPTDLPQLRLPTGRAAAQDLLAEFLARI